MTAAAGTGSPDSAPEARGEESGQAEAPGKRERILHVAAELFAENDYHRVLMDTIAEKAGVGKGTLYRYFQTKEDLFLAVLSYAVDLSVQRLRASLDGMESPVDQLRAACMQALRFFRENDGLFHVLYHQKALRCARGRADLDEKRDRLRHFVEHILLAGVERCAFTVEDTAFASAVLWGMIRTALRTAPPEEPLDHLAHRLVDLFAKGILSRGAGGP